MRYPPPEVINSWPAPNYVDPETRGQSLLVVNITLLSLCIIALAARLWSRLVILRSPGLDDVLITIAMVSLWSTYTAIASLQVSQIPTIGVSVTVLLGELT